MSSMCATLRLNLTFSHFKFSSGLSSSKFDGSAVIAFLTPSKTLDLGGDPRLVKSLWGHFGWNMVVHRGFTLGGKLGLQSVYWRLGGVSWREGFRKGGEVFLYSSLVCLTPLVYFPLNGSLSFGKDVWVHKDGGVVVADAWYWFASVD